MSKQSTIPRVRMPAYQIGDDAYVIDPGRERMFRWKGRTKNPRRLAAADAVVYDDTLLTVHLEGVRILLQHHIAGIQAELLAFEWLDEPIAYFEEPESLRAGDVAEFVGART